MDICGMCRKQAKNTRRNAPHQYLVQIEESRFFHGSNARSYEEKDYQCQLCMAKFTWSTNRNDLAWTLWMG